MTSLSSISKSDITLLPPLVPPSEVEHRPVQEKMEELGKFIRVFHAALPLISYNRKVSAFNEACEYVTIIHQDLENMERSGQVVADELNDDYHALYRDCEILDRAIFYDKLLADHLQCKRKVENISDLLWRVKDIAKDFPSYTLEQRCKLLYNTAPAIGVFSKDLYAWEQGGVKSSFPETFNTGKRLVKNLESEFRALVTSLMVDVPADQVAGVNEESAPSAVASETPALAAPQRGLEEASAAAASVTAATQRTQPVALTPQEYAKDIKHRILLIERFIRIALPIYQTGASENQLKYAPFITRELVDFIDILRADIQKAPEKDADLLEDFNDLCRNWRCLETRVSLVCSRIYQARLSSIVHRCCTTSDALKSRLQEFPAHPYQDRFTWLTSTNGKIMNMQKELYKIDRQYLTDGDLKLLKPIKTTISDLLIDCETLACRTVVAEAMHRASIDPAVLTQAASPVNVDEVNDSVDGDEGDSDVEGDEGEEGDQTPTNSQPTSPVRSHAGSPEGSQENSRSGTPTSDQEGDESDTEEPETGMSKKSLATLSQIPPRAATPPPALLPDG